MYDDPILTASASLYLRRKKQSDPDDIDEPKPKKSEDNPKRFSQQASVIGGYKCDPKAIHAISDTTHGDNDTASFREPDQEAGRCFRGKLNIDKIKPVVCISESLIQET